MEKPKAPYSLSEKEIQFLFRFVEKKFVRWYDLQIEIVDHLASSIENEISLNPGLSFEYALEKIYRGFGIFGFAKIVEERQNYLEKAAKKRWWSEIKNMFKWPEIIFSLFIVSILFMLSELLRNNLAIYFYIIYFGIILSPAVYILLNKKNIKKRLLMLEYGSQYFSIPVFFQALILPSASHVSAIVFIVFLFITILFELATFRTYYSVRKKAEALYPAAFN